MGEEISTSNFDDQDFGNFRSRLEQETCVLREWFAQQHFTATGNIAGFEVEAWLIDSRCRPAPVNEIFLQRPANPLVVPELARFNVEINTPPRPLSGDVFTVMHNNLSQTWTDCARTAAEIDSGLLMTGILPTLQDRDLTLQHMSPMVRYRALNDQVLRMRHHYPITLDIEGTDHLRARHHDVMLEAAATSFQLHLQVGQAQSVRHFNSAIILSAPMVAVAANSPFVFGYSLWEESRIPLFEQAVAVSPFADSRNNRVTFGNDYVHDSLLELFDENLRDYAILLPTLMDTAHDRLAHLRLHNGTIWRWNRPLVGIAPDGVAHLRLEHRVMPAGPSLADTLANAALFYGLMHYLVHLPQAPESRLPFAQARSNFYSAARHGLRAPVTWLDGRETGMHELLHALLPHARDGLRQMDIAPADIEHYLGIIEQRLVSGQNGAVWQRGYAAAHGNDMNELTCAYRDRQLSGSPVHEWVI